VSLHAVVGSVRRRASLLAQPRELRAKIVNLAYANPGLAAKFYPVAAEAHFFAVGSAHPQGETVPVPPPELWEGYGQTPDEFLTGGRKDVESMLGILGEAGYVPAPGQRILDFGCAAARMTRWLADRAAECEIWGVDISAPHIEWCKENLDPPLHFATTTTFPHLPFEDRYFDLVYCGSVFTHISDLADAWLLELKRIVKPRGYLYATIHDRHTIDVLLEGRANESLASMLERYEEERRILSSDFGMFSIGRSSKGGQVFYDVDYLARRWGRVLNVVGVWPEAYGYQTAVVLMRANCEGASRPA
jgi:SAM-dependent methyltransferase